MDKGVLLKKRLKKWHITQLALGAETGRDKAAISRQLSGEAELAEDVAEAGQALIRIARTKQTMTVAAAMLATILTAGYIGERAEISERLEGAASAKLDGLRGLASEMAEQLHAAIDDDE